MEMTDYKWTIIFVY